MALQTVQALHTNCFKMLCYEAKSRTLINVLRLRVTTHCEFQHIIPSTDSSYQTEVTCAQSYLHGTSCSFCLINCPTLLAVAFCVWGGPFCIQLVTLAFPIHFKDFLRASRAFLCKALRHRIEHSDNRFLLSYCMSHFGLPISRKTIDTDPPSPHTLPLFFMNERYGLDPIADTCCT